MTSTARPADSFRYTRDGETFTVSPSGGVTYLSAEGVTLARVSGPLPADVVASTVVELAFAGWTPTEGN